jgi:predicted ATPase
VNLSSRSLTLWFLGYPDAALADTNHCLKDARAINQAGSLFYALNHATIMHFLCRQYTTAESLANELCTLADEKGAVMVWKSPGLLFRGWILAVVSRATEAVRLITCGLAALPAGATLLTPVGLSMVAKSHSDLGQLDDAWRCIDQAKAVIEKTKETWFEAHVHRIAGEIALKSPEPDAKAEAYFERALAVARQQQAKSWELRAATSLARLWRDQGKAQQARELLEPVYGWFTEGFDTRDLKEAKALLHALSV